MKRPVWRYVQEATTSAPLEVVRVRLASLDSALPLSVCAPRLSARMPRLWKQTSMQRAEDGLRLHWTACFGGLLEQGTFEVRCEGGGCILRTEGKLKGWPLLWKIGLLGWRSEGLLRRFVAEL